MKKILTTSALTLVILLQGFPADSVITEKAADASVGLRIDFESLEDWAVFKFSDVDRLSAYDAVEFDGVSALKASSSHSASILSHTRLFDAHTYPTLRWRWRVDAMQQNAEPTRKHGDDFPIRLFVVFKFDPASANLLERIKAAPLKGRFGEWLPDRWLMYVWSSTPINAFSLVSPHTKRSHRIPLRQPNEPLAQWVTEEVDVVKDFERIFGSKPPREAWIAVMTDSDDTGEQALAFIDYIEAVPTGALP